MDILIVFLLFIIGYGLAWVGTPIGFILTVIAVFSKTSEQKLFLFGARLVVLGVLCSLLILSLGATGGGGGMYGGWGSEGTRDYLIRVYWQYACFFVLILFFAVMAIVLHVKAKKKERFYAICTSAILLLLIIGPILQSRLASDADPRKLSGAFSPSAWLFL